VLCVSASALDASVAVSVGEDRCVKVGLGDGGWGWGSGLGHLGLCNVTTPTQHLNGLEPPNKKLRTRTRTHARTRTRAHTITNQSTTTSNAKGLGPTARLLRQIPPLCQDALCSDLITGRNDDTDRCVVHGVKFWGLWCEVC